MNISRCKKDGKCTSKNSKSSATPSLKAMLALATDCFIASYDSPPSIRRSCVFPHLNNTSKFKFQQQTLMSIQNITIPLGSRL
jgi:hypothetical protein